MKAITTLGIIPLFACWLYAQADQVPSRTETTTTTTTSEPSSFEGTLVDAGCHSTRTEHHESSTTSNPDTGSHTTTSSNSTRTSTECPVTTTTSTFGLLTPDGRYVTFDPASNQRIIEVVKGNKYKRYIDAREPVKVKIEGSRHGDVVVLRTIE